MIPIVPIIAGLAIAYVVDRVLISNKKDSKDAEIYADDLYSGSDDSNRQQNSAGNETNRVDLKNKADKTNTEKPTKKDSNDEVSTNGATVSNVRSDQSNDDLSSKQLADAEKPSSTETE